MQRRFRFSAQRSARFAASPRSNARPPCSHSEAHTTRFTVSGVELAHTMGFRLRGLTRAVGAGLEGRLVVEGTRNAARARRLFDVPEVKNALVLLCGAQVRFHAVNLYPGGNLVVEVGVGNLDDFEERLLRFVEAIDAAAPRLESHALPKLAATSTASGAPATFSIEVRN